MIHIFVWFRITPGDERPLYRQIVHQVVEAIAGGFLRAGDRLPSHRDLAKHLVVAPLTVKKAYDELERSGHIRMARGQGTFVCESNALLSVDAKAKRLRPLIVRLAQEASLLGFSASDLGLLVQDIYRDTCHGDGSNDPS